MLTLSKTHNVPIKPSKVEGPPTSLTFLGIHLNASIAPERKQSLLQELSSSHTAINEKKTGVVISHCDRNKRYYSIVAIKH